MVRVRLDRFHTAATLVLFGNVLVRRLPEFGVTSVLKTVGVLVVLLLTVVMNGASPKVVGRSALLNAVARYGPWCGVVALSIRFRHWSLLPTKVLILVLLAAIVIDSFSHVRRLSGPVLSAFVILLMLFGADLVVSRVVIPLEVEWLNKDFLVRDPLLGYRAAANCTTRAVATHRDRVAYDVSYTTDSYGRRSIPDCGGEITPCHAIFAGGSFVFGDGVENSETMPAQFASLVDDYRVYNYGFPGYGAQHMYARLAARTLHREIPESSGVMIYCMYPHHFDRAVGSALTLIWGRDFPRFVARGESLALAGSFASSQPLKVRLFDLAGLSPAFYHLLLRADPVVHARMGAGLRTLTLLVVASAQEYTRQFNGSFQVVIWPNRDPRTPEFAEAIASRGIAVTQLERYGLPLPKERYAIPIEGHPTGEYYGLAAQVILRTLREASTDL